MYYVFIKRNLLLEKILINTLSIQARNNIFCIAVQHFYIILNCLTAKNNAVRNLR